MKKLQNTLYVTTEDIYLAFENDNVTCIQEGKITARFPLHNIENIVYFGYKGASPQLMEACAKRQIDLSFFSSSGRFRARICGETRGNILIRKEQYRISDSIEESVDISRNFIFGKIYNERQLLKRALRDHPLQVDVEAIEGVVNVLTDCINTARTARNIEELRGIEGVAAKSYFSVFNQLIYAEKEFFAFSGRNRRPPTDPTNALLSFAYTMLTNACASGLESVGLDPYAGFMHQDRPGRKSLSLDLAEELRTAFADRVVLNCINNRMLNSSHFWIQENGAVLLSDEGKSVFLKVWQEKKKETITHPYLKEKVSWGLIPYVQSLLLARLLRGDIEGYPSFFWR